MRKTSPENRGSKIILFSTPKLVQHMVQEQMPMSEDEMVNILSQGISDNIVIMGITDYDLEVNTKISLPVRELARQMMEPNGIRIVF